MTSQAGGEVLILHPKDGARGARAATPERGDAEVQRVNLREIEQFGIWEVGLLISFKKEVDQRSGVLRICQLDRALDGYFHNDRLTEQFDIYPDLETAMTGARRELQ